MRCRLACLGILAGLLSGCVGDRAFQAVPEALVLDAEIPGYGTIRSWGDKAPADSADQVAKFKRQIAQRIVKEGKRPNGGRIHILLLSGGGSDGAFGAGLLAGWSKRGDRPEFALVTGISTGALIAPFAFLGPEYDEDLEKFYTDTKTDDVLIPRIWGALTGDLLGFADTTLLSATLERTVTPEFVELIAAEHRKGRRLLVGTTNLDAQRPVVWNIGEIAASDVPGKHRLITEILLASASIPGAFPPVQFQVQAGDERYSEMHVDGGVTRQLFFLPFDFKLNNEDFGQRMQRGTIYAVRNTKLDPSYEETPARVFNIAARSISTLIKAAGKADVELLNNQARAAGFTLAVTAVPESFKETENELFDPVYMRALFTTGYKMATEGDPWTIVVSKD